MPIFEVTSAAISPLKAVSFSSAGVYERGDLQRLLREHVEVISEDTLVISEEFGEWDDSRRRIDLLGIDKEANLVVIELKRTDDGGHMELQSIRYGAMVRTMTFEQAVNAYEQYLDKTCTDKKDPRSTILEFLGWDEPADGVFAQSVRVVLASAEFSKELTSTVLWLNEYGIDIRCVRLKPYALDGRILIDVQQIIPPPESMDYQVQLREKAREGREVRVGGADFTRFDIQFGDERHPAQWKRNAIFLLCKRLCENGINPDDIAALFSWRVNRVWYTVEGTVDVTKFEEAASAKDASGGPRFDPRRWFRDDDDLLHANGKTYAFTRQWGGPSWHRAMDTLKEKYPQFRIEFTAIS